CSTDPHLHFEVRNGPDAYEPAAGACRAGSSLWERQQGHVYDNRFSVFYTGTSSVLPTQDLIKFRPPDTTHLRQTINPFQYFWVRLLDVHPGDVSQVTFKRPNATGSTRPRRRPTRSSSATGGG